MLKRMLPRLKAYCCAHTPPSNIRKLWMRRIVACSTAMALVALVGFVVLPYCFQNNMLHHSPKGEVYAAAPEHSSLTPLPLVQKPSDMLVVSTTGTNGGVSDEERYPTLQLNDNSENVASLQLRLMDLGYLDYDEEKTVYCSVTESSIKLFQRVQGLPTTGIADSKTQSLLFSNFAIAYHMKLGDKGSDVRGLQRQLYELGYYNEKINGYFGRATEKAVLAFQQKNDLETTGEVTLEMRNFLYSPQALPLIDPPASTPVVETPKPPTSTPKPVTSATPTPKVTTTPRVTPMLTPTPGQATPTPTIYIPNIDPDELPEPDDPDITVTPTPDDDPIVFETPTPATPTPPIVNSQDVDALIEVAQAQLGKPYVWSEEGPDSFDCSGLVYYCLRQIGVKVGRYNAISYSQLSQWTAVNSLSDVKKGDLLFFKADNKDYVNHTGIYIGGNQFIHASSTNGKVVVGSLSGYYNRNFVIGRRVF